MMEYIELGPTPPEEDCAQLGSDDFTKRAKKEMTAYVNQLNREFPDAESKGIHFSIKWFNHDFGRYGEVVANWDTDDEIANEYVYVIDSSIPTNWDREALQELNLEPSKLESKDNGNWG